MERERRVEWRERKDSSCEFCRNSTLQAKCRLRHKGLDEREGEGLRGEWQREGKGERGGGRRRKEW